MSFGVFGETVPKGTVVAVDVPEVGVTSLFTVTPGFTPLILKVKMVCIEAETVTSSTIAIRVSPESSIVPPRVIT